MTGLERRIIDPLPIHTRPDHVRHLSGTGKLPAWVVRIRSFPPDIDGHLRLVLMQLQPKHRPPILYSSVKCLLSETS